MSWQAGRKRRLLSGLTGTVLEIGAGRGVNFGFFGPDVAWIGLEPDRRRAAALRRLDHGGPVLEAPAESIPLADGTCDAVVSTIVLCSVRDQAATLAEVLRVLRPGGRFVFLEHVAAAPGSRTRRLQRWWAPVSRRIDKGCDPARDTAAAIGDAGFAEVELVGFRQPTGFGLAVPCIEGSARKTVQGKV